MRNLILAIDQGTTSTRCIAFDSTGAVTHSASLEFPQIYPNSGWVEHDPEAIFQSVVSCIDRLNLNANEDAIKAVGITNQRETIVAWDRETCRPFHNAIVWLDTRTKSMVDKIGHSGGIHQNQKITGLPVSTYFSALKIKWLIDNVPEIPIALASKTCCFGTIDSYLTYRLTGNKKVFVTDCANASRYNLMDIHTLDWSVPICFELGIPIHSLPKIVSNSEIVGHISSSIPKLENVPIASLIGDQHAALLGHGCVHRGGCKITYGTGSFLLMNTDKPVFSPSGALLTTMAFKLGPTTASMYALEGSVASAGRSVQWAKDNLRIGENLIEFNELAASVPDTCGVTFVPAFSGLFAPYWRDDARAVIVGMSLRSNYRHIARSILEATAVQCAQVLELLEVESGIEMDSVVTDGGMTKSDLLMQMQSDLLNKEIKRSKMPESTAFGAAYAAGLCVGFWDTSITVPLYDSFMPNMSETERRNTFTRWDDAVKRSFGLTQFSDN